MYAIMYIVWRYAIEWSTQNYIHILNNISNLTEKKIQYMWLLTETPKYKNNAI